MTRQNDGPIIHFAARSDAEERVHMGPSLCGSGRPHRTENEQYVAGDWAFVDCKNCHRLLALRNAREDAEDAEAAQMRERESQ